MPTKCTNGDVSRYSTPPTADTSTISAMFCCEPRDRQAGGDHGGGGVGGKLGGVDGGGVCGDGGSPGGDEGAGIDGGAPPTTSSARMMVDAVHSANVCPSDVTVASISSKANTKMLAWARVSNSIVIWLRMGCPVGSASSASSQPCTFSINSVSKRRPLGAGSVIAVLLLSLTRIEGPK
jgi:hypothetical protein